MIISETLINVSTRYGRFKRKTLCDVIPRLVCALSSGAYGSGSCLSVFVFVWLRNFANFCPLNRRYSSKSPCITMGFRGLRDRNHTFPLLAPFGGDAA
jgi:hypothetical protein